MRDLEGDFEGIKEFGADLAMKELDPLMGSDFELLQTISEGVVN